MTKMVFLELSLCTGIPNWNHANGTWFFEINNDITHVYMLDIKDAQQKSLFAFLTE